MNQAIILNLRFLFLQDFDKSALLYSPPPHKEGNFEIPHQNVQRSNDNEEEWQPI